MATKEKFEELTKLIHDAVEEIRKKDKELSETKELVEKYAKEIEEKISEVRKGAFYSGGDVEDRDIKSILESPAVDSEIKRIHELNDAWYLARTGLKDFVPVDKIDKMFSEYISREVKSFNLGAGEGGDFVPTGFSRTFFEEVMVNLAVADLHETIDMPQNPYKFPIVYHDEMGYLVSENTANTFTEINADVSSSNMTGAIQLDAKKLAAKIRISEEIVEDSIIPVADVARKRLTTAIAKAIETAIINGDTAATHMDADVTSASDPRKAFDGYRKIANNGTAKIDGGGTAINADTIINARALMGKYGLNPNELAFVCSVTTYLKDLINLKDSSGNPLVITRDKYGAQATILTGEMGKIFGIPIVPSAFVREDLNASGVYDGTTKNTTIGLIVYRPGFIIGKRREATIRSAREVQTDQTIIVATTRLAFATPWNGENIVGLVYNIVP